MDEAKESAFYNFTLGNSDEPFCNPVCDLWDTNQWSWKSRWVVLRARGVCVLLGHD